MEAVATLRAAKNGRRVGSRNSLAIIENAMSRECPRTGDKVFTSRECEPWGMSINVGKTEYLAVGNTKNEALGTRFGAIPKSSIARYLG